MRLFSGITVQPFIKAVMTLSAPARWLLDNVVRPVWDGIKSAIKAFYDSLMALFSRRLRILLTLFRPLSAGFSIMLSARSGTVFSRLFVVSGKTALSPFLTH